MKKRARTSGFSWSRRQTVILVITIVIVGAWGCFYSFAVEHYGHQYAIALTALLVASIATIGTLLALKWTRDTVRPFISSFGTIPISHTPDTVTLTFKMQNSGSIPGSDVHTDIDFFDEDEEVTEDNVSKRYQPPNRQSSYGLMLPNDIHYEKYILDLTDKDDVELWENITEGKVKLRLRTMYESLGRKHLTIQTERIVKLKGQKELQLIPFPPQKWE